jgi:hypothetical protein
VATVLSHFDEKTMHGLHICSDALSRNPDIVIKPAHLDELVEDLESFAAAVAGAEIDDDIRDVLFDGVDRMQRATFDYRYRGAASVREATEQGMGGVGIILLTHDSLEGEA